MATTIEPVYVVDTHTLLWHLMTDKKLSASARAIFAAAERGETRLIVSVIVLAELHYANKKHKFFTDFQKFHEGLSKKPHFKFLSLEVEDLLEFDMLNLVPEMHDRILVAIARRLKAPLITIDPLIKASGLVRIVW
jgi:PIN domain nuclease of toxin-antitoxin system